MKADNKNKDKNEESLYDSIKDTGAVTVVKGEFNIFCLTIIGEIEGHSVLPEQSKTTKYEHIIPQLVAIEESDNIDGMLIVLNTIGGDVEAGLAISELIAGMNKPTVSIVIGGGHSIGVPLAVSSDYSFIVPSATMTIHPVRTSGLVIGVPQMMNHFSKMQGRISNFVVEHSSISIQRFEQLLMNTDELVTDVGSVLDGEMAVKEGLIDGLGSLSNALDKLYELIRNNKKSG